MQFRDREEAAHLLAHKLSAYRGKNPLILAIPRGAAVMGRILADELGGELDVVLVRKLGAPYQPELAIGSVDEHGHVFLTEYAHRTGADDVYVAREKRHQLEVLATRRRLYTAARSPIDPKGRIVIVVDDGIATGSTMIAALKSVRERRPERLIAAAAVAPPENVERIRPYADEVVCVATPSEFYAVGQFFQNFSQVEDADVITLLKQAAAVNDPEVTIPAGGIDLPGNLTVPGNAKGLVLFAHGSGSSRLSPRNRYVADVLHKRGIGTLLFDLMTPAEDRNYENRFDIPFLARRLIAATLWLAGEASGAPPSPLKNQTGKARFDSSPLPLGYFGASTGAAAALIAAAEMKKNIACVVSRGGRPDLAMEVLDRVTAPTLLIVGGYDDVVIELNKKAYAALSCEKELSIVPGATHLFEEPGALKEAAGRAADWFEKHLKRKIP